MLKNISFKRILLEAVLHGNDTALFEELDPSRHTRYECFIFAYNKSTGEARYIVTYSRYMGEMRPYYLKLEW